MLNFETMKSEWVLFSNEKKHSQNTQASYLFDIEQFNRWTEDNSILNVEDVTEDNIKEYRDYIINTKSGKNGKKRMPKTFNRHRSAISSFFEAIRKNGYRKDNPLTYVTSEKTKVNYQGRLKIKEVDRLFESTKNRKSCHSIRNYALTQIAIKTGLRASEIRNLSVEQVKTDFWEIIGKGSIQKYINIAKLPEVREAIDTYLEVRPECEFNNLFINQKLVPLETPGIRHSIKKSTSDIGHKLTTHGMRRTFATIIYEETGGNEAIVDRALGYVPKGTGAKNYIDPEARANILGNVISNAFRKEV